MKRIFFLLSAIVLLSGALYGAVRLSKMGFIEDIAGIPGKRGYAGDGGDALKARLANPMGLALDRWNNIYIADTRNHRVRRIDVRTGRIDTIAGTGKAGFENDGGNADAAQLNGPTALAFDAMGNLYIADSGNQRIRLLDRKGYLHTIAGNGRKGYEGEGTKAKNSPLNNPTGIAINSKGQILIADTGNHRIRMIEPVSGKLVTVVGNGEARDEGDLGLAINASLNRPTAIILDKYDNLYIADTGNHKIRFVDHKSGYIFTLGGSGEPGFRGDNNVRSTDALFNEPTGLALDRKGRVYVADTNNQRIRRITIDRNYRSGYVETVAGSGKRGYNGSNKDAWEAQMAYPGAMAINGLDIMYFLDTGNNLLRRIQGVSSITAPTSYSEFGKNQQPVDGRSFYEVLFSDDTKDVKKTK